LPLASLRRSTLAQQEEIKVGIIGGSGLYDMAELINREEIAIRTPFGATSDHIVTGEISGHRVAFIARHGRGHRYMPSEVPYAANIYALKALGVQYIIALSACGSLREDYAPGHICIPDQLVDRTTGLRKRTFFGEGVVAHVGTANPFTPELCEVLGEAAIAAGGTVHMGGTFVTVEGPRFSTRAESETFRSQGYSIIGMTTSPEAFLAAEAEIAYAVFAHITDYDVWHSEAAEVTAAMVMDTFRANLRLAQQAVVEAVPRVAAIQGPLAVHSGLQGAIMTNRADIPPATFDKLRLLIGKYYSS
jgi:5'-methylthioadenosine phosphorylase